MKKILLFVFFQAFILGLMAQNVDFKQENFPNKTKKEFRAAVKNNRLGKSSLRGEDYRTALDFFTKANEFNPKNAELNYNMAVCYGHLTQYANAAKYAGIAASIDSTISNDVLYYKGYASQLNGEFNKAIKYYREYLKVPGISAKGNNNAKRRIQECKNAKDLVKQEVSCKVYLLDTSVNCKYDDYGPAVTADDGILFFTTRRGEKKCGKERSMAPDGKFIEKIYRSERDSLNKWDDCRLTLGAAFRGHFAISGVSNDGQKVIIYKGKHGGDLYEAKLRGTSFGRPKRLPKFVNTKYHESSASYSYDGNTIYFCSDRTDMGYGGHDIYKLTKNEKGKWANVENLGNVINTPDDELTVFIHPDNKTLYFSSNGHKGMGGYDIYVSKNVNGCWSTPDNLGVPINSPLDEIHFVITANGKSAYYASSKEGGIGEEDIYGISFKTDQVFLTITENNSMEDGDPDIEESEILEKGLPAPQLTLLTGVVRDKYTKEPIAAKCELIDLDSNKTIANFQSKEDDGKFLVSLPAGKRYKVTINKDGYISYEENFDIPDSSGYKIEEKSVELESDGSVMPVGLDNIVFEFDKSNIVGIETENNLKKVVAFLQANPDVKLHISGHTDNKGSVQYNQALSVRRAKAAYDYIVDNGIDAKRLTYEGYGLSNPIATNDTEEGRTLNRRVEFKIIK